MSIIIMLLLLSVLILVHEAGHFLAARMFGIKVEKFGFGLPVGPTLYKTKWGETEILIHAFLLGGYVAFPDDDKDCKLDEKSEDRFLNRPLYQRAIVVSAGVFANVVCAFVLVYLTAILWGNLPSGNYDIYINDVIAPKTESIWHSGVQKGDKIDSINGIKIQNTYGLLKIVKLSASYDGKVDDGLAVKNFASLKELNPIFKRDEIIPKNVAINLPERTLEPPIKLNYMELKGAKKYVDSQLVLSKEQKELRDELIGKNVYISDGKYSLLDVAKAISDNSRPLNITVLRKNEKIKLLPVTPNKDGLLGIKLEAKEVLAPCKTPKQIFVQGNKYLWDNTYMMVYGLYQIFTGKVPLKDLHGIVAITKVGGDIITNSGIFYGLLLTAIISIDLAIVNFLPIPALDGGHIFFMIIEKIRRKPIKEETLNRIANAGFAFLIILTIFVIANDIFGLITKQY